MGKYLEIPTDKIKDKYAKEVMTRLNTKILPTWSDYFRKPMESIDKELRKLPYPYKISPHYAKYFEYIPDIDEVAPFPIAFIFFQFFWSTQVTHSFRISREELYLFEKCLFDILPLRVEEKIVEILSEIAKQPVYIHLNPREHELDPKVSYQMLKEVNDFFNKTEEVWK